MRAQLTVLFLFMLAAAAMAAAPAERIGTVSAMQGAATAKQGDAAPRALAIGSVSPASTQKASSALGGTGVVLSGRGGGSFRTW